MHTNGASSQTIRHSRPADTLLYQIVSLALSLESENCKASGRSSDSFPSRARLPTPILISVQWHRAPRVCLWQWNLQQPDCLGFSPNSLYRAPASFDPSTTKSHRKGTQFYLIHPTLKLSTN